MNLLTQIKHKTQKGEEVIMDIGAKASNVLPENFVEQKERSNLAAKDKLPVIFGKLSKWYADLRPVAWSGSYSDLTNKPTIPEGSAANYQVANNDTTEAEGFVADARIVRTHGLEIDGLSRDLGGCSFEQEGDNFYVVGADAVRKKLGSSGIGGTLETVAVRDRTVMTRNYIFNNTGDYVSLVLNVKTPPNGGNANSVTVYGTAIGTSTYKQIQKITTLNADVTVNIKGYDHIKLAVTASHSGNVGHSYEATTITTYALS